MKYLVAYATLSALFAMPALAQPPEGAPVVEAAPPANTPLVVSKTTVEETPDATVEKTTEIIIPISDRPALDPENPIAPEVQAVVDSKKHYTTADLANAQLAAVIATPPSEPTTVITTTTTTPKSDS